MSVVERFQAVLVAGAAALGFGVGLLLTPGAAAAAGGLVLPALLIMLVGVFSQLSSGRLGAIRDARGLLAASLVLNFVFTPALAWALGAGLLGGQPDLRIGLLLLLVTPCTDWYLVFTAAARGHTGIGAALLPLNLGLQLVLLPVYVLLLGGQAAMVDARTLAEAVLLVLLVPLAVAFVLRRTGAGERYAPAIGTATPLLLCLAVAAMFAAHARTVTVHGVEILMLLPALLAFFLVLPVLAVLAARLLRLPADRRVTLIMVTTARNSPIALGLAVTAFPDRPLIALALVVGPLLELPVLALLAQLVRAAPPRRTPPG